MVPLKLDLLRIDIDPNEERRQTGGPSIKHRIQARFDVVARRPRPRQPDDPAIRRREQPHFGAVEALPLPAPRRVASVDALRGFTMFWIIGADGAARSESRRKCDGSL